MNKLPVPPIDDAVSLFKQIYQGYVDGKYEGPSFVCLTGPRERDTQREFVIFFGLDGNVAHGSLMTEAFDEATKIMASVTPEDEERARKKMREDLEREAKDQ